MSRLPELIDLERTLESVGKHGRVKILGNVHHRELSFPLYAISFGTGRSRGTHVRSLRWSPRSGRIGSRRSLSLHTVNQLLNWDKTFHSLLKKTRLVFMPIVNPGGMYLRRRSNPNGVDLMRNAPVRADRISPWVLYAGHRISRHLPWYRGPAGAPMEIEAQAVCDFVQAEILQSKVAITLDVHSGYGTVDRVWFPYAKSKKPFPQTAEVFALKNLLDQTYPNHIYCVEPQSREYMTHGDLWDYLYDEHRKNHDGIFIPLSLELGSWLWVKKNLRQVFNPLGAFNPLIPHRLQRTLRRHLIFFEFLHRVVLAPEAWAHLEKDVKENYRHRALELWYG